MTSLRLLGFSLGVLAATASTSSAQSAPAVSQDAIVKLTLTIEPQRVRFTTPGEVLDWRLEITDVQGQPVFDSAFLTSSALDWSLVDVQGQPVASGVYRYAITIRDPRTDRTRRGELMIERASPVYRVAVSGDEPGGSTSLAIADASAAEPVTNAGDAVMLPTNLGRASFTSPQPYISGTGTTNRLARWIDGPNGVLGDTNIAESSGNMVLGNGSFIGNLQIFGSAGNDVFAGMGPDVVNGPAFNYGYAGGSFGRSAGFFNVRPDASATAPNPSLRFMTTNVERMIVTNTGNVGIGSSAPSHRLRVSGGPYWTFGTTWTGALELDDASAIGWRSNAGGYSWGIGHRNGGTYFFSTTSQPGTTSNAPGYQMVITDAGDVGIGTNSPGARLQVVGGGASDAVSASTGSGRGVYGISSTGIGVQGTGNANIGVYGSSSNGTGVYGTTGAASHVGVFGVATSGGVGVVGSSDSYIGVEGDSITSTGVTGISNSGYGVSGSSYSGYGGYFYSVSSYAGYFQGNVYATGTITQNSDARLKHDVADLRYGLKELLQLRPVTWLWNDRPDRSRQLGLIAQEIEPVLPELVAHAKDDQQTLGLNYIGLVPVVINAIQEEHATVLALQAENAALKARLAAIEHALAETGRSRKR